MQQLQPNRSLAFLDRLREIKDSQRKRLDDLNSRLEKTQLSPGQKRQCTTELAHREAEYLRQLREKVSMKTFETITTLGHGAYGQVLLVRHRTTKELHAMKILSKATIVQRKQQHYLKLERDLMASSLSKWLIRLHSAFQDEASLYLVMDYAPGGDLMGLLIRRDRFPEEVARFYVAEIAVAFNDLHKNGVIYRDGKPDNVLITASGHVRLTDFGLSCRAAEYHAPEQCCCEAPNVVDKKCQVCGLQATVFKSANHSRLQAFSAVGTQNYTAVEVFRRNGYTEACDFWALGCIAYEMLFGFAPFASESFRETRKKIMNFKESFVIANGKVSAQCEDFLRKLICEPEERMGFEQIMKHKWMDGVDFASLEECIPPFVPKLKSDIDTQYFDQAGEAVVADQTQQKFWDDSEFQQFSIRAFPTTQGLQQQGRVSLKEFMESVKKK